MVFQNAPFPHDDPLSTTCREPIAFELFPRCCNWEKELESSGAAADVARQRHLFFPEVEIYLQAQSAEYRSTILRSRRLYLSSVPGLPVHPARHDNLTRIHGKKKGA